MWMRLREVGRTEPLMITPPGMRVGWWIEVRWDDGASLWVRIAVLSPPDGMLEDRWTIHVTRGRWDWWVKAADHVALPVCDVDPGRTRHARGGDPGRA